jgi:hypothetical protein
MKSSLLSAFLLLVFLSSSCDDSGTKKPTESIPSDTAKTVYLEDLLKIKSEAELKAKFGAARVTYDTIWGPEGAFTMGTYLDKGKPDEVEITWDDSLRREGVTYVSIEAGYDSQGRAIFNNKWSSSTGLRLGLNIDDLEKLNGKPFIFSGLDWDYGGGVNWNGGKMEKTHIGATLGHNNNESQLTEEEMSVIMGDHDVKSDDPVVKKVQPVVMGFIVWNE